MANDDQECNLQGPRKNQVAHQGVCGPIDFEACTMCAPAQPCNSSRRAQITKVSKADSIFGTFLPDYCPPLNGHLLAALASLNDVVMTPSRKWLYSSPQPNILALLPWI